MTGPGGSAGPRVAVLGATGQLGRRVVAHLRDRGADVVEVSRRQGVDVRSGAGLDAVLAGVGTVVDCLDMATVSRRRATSFFETTARNVSAAAERAGVRRIVCVSIVGVSAPGVQRALGYYAGKAAQERAYRAGAVPVSVVASAQWYELAETFLDQLRVGPVAFVLGMRCRPLALDDAAALTAAHVLGSATSDVQLAGPEVHDMAGLARAVSERRGGGPRVVRVPVPFTALGSGGLLPTGDVTTAPTRFQDWLDAAAS